MTDAKIARANVPRPSHRLTAGQVGKFTKEAAGLLRRPQRAFPLIQKLVADSFRSSFPQRNLYSYATTGYASEDTLTLLLRWILDAQRSDGGIAAYYSLLTGYSQSYPEVTGYLVPTLYDIGCLAGNPSAVSAAERATRWLLELQLPTGAFSGGLQGSDSSPSVFNTGQILQGLVRAHRETNRPEILVAAVASANWLVETQKPDGTWSGAGAYQQVAHTYYSMVAWALAELSEHTGEKCYGLAAEKHIDWVLAHFRSDGWIDGINLQDRRNYLHFIAYALQGVLECAMLRSREDAIALVSRSAWRFLKKFEIRKFLPGAYGSSFKSGDNFTCLTGNAQISCLWLRLFEWTGDLRYFNAALKMNEMLKGLLPRRGVRGVVGGVSGSYPIWGRYQPLRYISWGCKFFADALMLEQRLKGSFRARLRGALPCAS